MISDTNKGLLIAFCGALALSFDTLLLRLIDGQPLQMAFWRGLFMFLAGYSVYFFIRRFGYRSIRFINGSTGILVASFYGLASVCFVASAMMTTIANMLVIVATAPFWAAIGATVFLDERPTAGLWIASTVAFCGIVIVAWPGLQAGLNLGDGIALLAAISMAGAFVTSRRTDKNLMFAPSLGGLISTIVVFPFVGTFGFETDAATVLMAIEGAFLVPIALGLIAAAPRYLPAPQVGLFLLLETVLGPLWIWLALAERPSTYALVGGGIVVMTLSIHSVNSFARMPDKAGSNQNRKIGAIDVKEQQRNNIV